MMSKWLERVLSAVATDFMRPTETDIQSGKMAMFGKTEGAGEAAVSQWMPEIVGDGRNLQCPLQAHVLISCP